MITKNPHFAEAQAPAADALPRLRTVTNSPAQEYRERPGQVETLPDALAALFLAKKVELTVSRQCVSFKMDGETFKYFHPDSLTIRNALPEHEGRAIGVVNRMDTSRLHVMTADGRYVETLPLKGKAGFFQPSDQLQQARHALGHAEQRLEALHGKTTRELADAAAQNSSQLKVLVATLPADGVTATPGAAPGRAAVVAEAMNRAAADRTRARTVTKADISDYRRRQAAKAYEQPVGA